MAEKDGQEIEGAPLVPKPPGVLLKGMRGVQHQAEGPIPGTTS